MENNIQIIRKNLGLSQIELADLLNIPVKSIRNWENNERKPTEYMMQYIIDTALRRTNEQKLITENEEFILSFLTIKEKVKLVCSKYDIDKVYLYGSYAKGLADKNSDIDLYMVSDIYGIDYFGIIEELRSYLNKKVDLLSNKTVKPGSKIEHEIKKTGVLIYER